MSAWKRRVPRRLALIIEKAMAIDPKARYRSASELESDLNAWTCHLPTSLDGRSPVIRALLWLRRTPWSVTAILLLVVLLVTMQALDIVIEGSHGHLRKIAAMTARVEQGQHAARTERERFRTELADAKDRLTHASNERDLAIKNGDAANQQRLDAVRRADREKLEKDRARQDLSLALAEAVDAVTKQLAAEQQLVVAEQREHASEQRARSADRRALAAEERSTVAEGKMKTSETELGNSRRRLHEARAEVKRLSELVSSLTHGLQLQRDEVAQQRLAERQRCQWQQLLEQRPQ
jgi:hypothetical protein